MKANKGAAGVDALDINQTAEHLRWAWPTLRQQLLQGTYRPQPVRRVGIPKSDGSERELGIPTVTDRLSRRVNDTGVARLVRAYLNAGMMDGGVAIRRVKRTPKGGPLLPLPRQTALEDQ